MTAQHGTFSPCHVQTSFRITELEKQCSLLEEQHKALEQKCVQAESQKAEVEEKLQQLTQVKPEPTLTPQFDQHFIQGIVSLYKCSMSHWLQEERT